jgi:hypothetical protein
MDWDTIGAFYDHSDTYTKQLRKLEVAAKKYPRRVENHFLLAYHYLALDERDAASEELAAVVKLQPKDTLARQLLESLKQQARVDPPQEDLPGDE